MLYLIELQRNEELRSAGLPSAAPADAATSSSSSSSSSISGAAAVRGDDGGDDSENDDDAETELDDEGKRYTLRLCDGIYGETLIDACPLSFLTDVYISNFAHPNIFCTTI